MQYLTVKLNNKHIIPSKLDNILMNIADQHKKAAEFIERWQGRGDEKQETQKFWLEPYAKRFGHSRRNKQYRV
ncbi:hypothetical protein BFS15_03575 [Gardnerella sp. DNF01162]|nr:hypothetical protein CJ215_01405 [Gardnerella vaginalis]PNP91853.1 hypothetical protein BFS15_03575 [Gardnerella sp. DNF01162]RFD73049.1 hypothetical protein AXE72_03110 [Gardnerella vaginalis]